MRTNPVILRIIACCLLLVFVQKAGAGLFFHNALHSDRTKHASSSQNEQGSINYNCSCGDDFLLPFTAAETIVFNSPGKVKVVATDFYLAAFFKITTTHSFLRGPPAIA